MVSGSAVPTAASTLPTALTQVQPSAQDLHRVREERGGDDDRTKRECELEEYGQSRSFLAETRPV
jgi:hypothetical protein